MVYLVVGNDFKNIQLSLREIVEKFFPATSVSYGADTFSPEVCQEKTLSQGLFGERQVIILDGVFTNEEHETYCLKNIERLKDSETVFIIKEEKLTASQKKKIEAHAKETFFFDEAKNTQETFSVFSLTDALGKRDKKKAWLLLCEGLEKGVAPENLYGTLFWQAKVMYMVKETLHKKESTTTLGLNPFVVRKAEGFSKNYTKEENKKLLSSLLETYHAARSGKEDLSIGLERFVLSL